MRNLLERSLSGVIYVLLFIASILFSEQSYLVLIVLFGLITVWEFSKIINYNNLLLYIVFLVVVFLIFKTKNVYILYTSLSLTLLSSLSLVYQLFLKKKILSSSKVLKFSLTVRYIIFSYSFLVILPYLGDSFHPYFMIGLLSIIWINDSFAYLVGKNFGKRKLFESVSPNKTIEGFLGGFIFALISSYFIFRFNSQITFINWIVITIIVSVFGTIGDLIESKFKRQANVKDSGSIMPGHGGILDRLDSLLFVAPFVYLYINIFI